MSDISVWDSPELSNQMFDSLLEDVTRDLVERTYTEDPNTFYPVIWMALWDEENHNRNWGSVSMVDYPDEDKDRSAMFAAAGKVAVESGQLPVAAFFQRRGNMIVEDKEGGHSLDGFMVIGMTDDNRLNASFVALTGDSDVGHDVAYATQFWRSSEMTDEQTMDTDVLNSFYKTAKEMYRISKGEKVDHVDTDELTKGLFHDVNGL